VGKNAWEGRTSRAAQPRRPVRAVMRSAPRSSVLPPTSSGSSCRRETHKGAPRSPPFELDLSPIATAELINTRQGYWHAIEYRQVIAVHKLSNCQVKPQETRH